MARKAFLTSLFILSVSLFGGSIAPSFGELPPALLNTANAQEAVEQPNTATNAQEENEQPLAPTQYSIEKARVVSRLLQKYHYGERGSEKDLHVDAANTYLRILDPARFYLLEKDVERFRDRMSAAADGDGDGDGDGDDIEGRLRAAFKLYSTFRERVEERVDHALSLLDSPPEFSADQRFEQDRRDAAWADSEEEQDKLWAKRVAHDYITLEFAERDQEQITENLQDRYRNTLQRAREAEQSDITGKFLDAWARAYDPHSSYFSPRRSEEFDMEMSLELEGIGAKLTMEQDMTEIVELIPGGPAERSGKLEPGERIIGVADGEDGEMKDIVGWQLRDVVELIRGPKESTVRLKIMPPAGASETTPRVVKLIRNKVALEDQAARKRIIEKPYEDGTQRIGVIEIPRFYRDFNGAQAGEGDFRSTARDVKGLLKELKEEGIDGLIIDLRGNSGGALQEAIGVTSLFTGGGVVVQVRHHDGSIDHLGKPDQKQLYDGPLAVMVDRRSASASEILAGAIQDYDRGIIIGSQTFGKGTVQHMIDLGAHGLAREGGDEEKKGQGRQGAGRLKLTIAQFYRVSGKSTQLVGVTPDISLPSILNHDEYGERAADNPLPAKSINPVEVPQYFELSPIITKLRSRHQQRIQQDEAFQAFQQQLEYRSELREDTTIPLRRQARKEEQERREQRLLELHNQRRKAHGFETVESYDKIDRDELPDLLLQAGAEIVKDQSLLLAKRKAERGPFARLFAE